MSLLVPIVLMGCGHDYESTPEELEAQRKYREQQAELEKHTIFAFYQFDKLAKPDPAEIGGAFGVKILLDRNGNLHFLDTKTWPFHYPFCVNILGETRTLQEFNEQVYTGLDRSMMFGTVMVYPIGVGIKRNYCLELNPADPMTDLETILDFFALVQKNFIPSENHVLKFHPTSSKQLEVAKSEQFKWPVITSAELFANLEYKCVQQGQLPAKYLRIFDKKEFTVKELTDWLNQRTIDDIVVVPTVPADIPIVGAVISEEIIPPLCHVALLCQNRKTPCCFKSNIIDILMNERQLTNQVVSSVIAKEGLCLHFENAVVEPPWDVPSGVQIRQADLSVASLVDSYNFDLNSVGTKAHQISRVQAHYNQSIMTGTFAIPFYYYHAHVSKLSNVDNLQPKEIQQFITSQDVAEELISSVIQRIKDHKWSAVIFRSSTNCEDLEQFNGAGLYDSVPLSGDELADRTKVQRAIKQVWASVWNHRAVRERDFYKIPHKDVNMAILVQPYLDNKMNGSLAKVQVNGVCITHDVGHHKVKHGFYVNCFPGSDIRATNHYKDATPEEVMLVLGREEIAVDLRLIRQSNQSEQMLISQHDAETMARVFGDLHTAMLGKPHKMDDTVALDIEFMIVDNAVTGNPRELVVLQARPYQVYVAPPYLDYSMQLRLSINLHPYDDEKNYSFRFEYNG